MAAADFDEHRRDPGAQVGWREVFSFEVVDDAGRALVVRWTLLSRSAWYWMFLADPDGSVVVVRDPELPRPRGRTLELRGDGLWAEGVCEEPHRHWSLGLESFAVRLDSAGDAWEGERGHRMPIGFGLDWTSEHEPGEIAGGYAQAGTLSGIWLDDQGEHDFSGGGIRLHRWGPAPSYDELRIVASDRVRAVAVDAARDEAGLVAETSTAEGVFTPGAVVAVAGEGRRALAAGEVRSQSETLPGWIETGV